jgi:hypothetical protein
MVGDQSGGGSAPWTRGRSAATLGAPRGPEDFAVKRQRCQVNHFAMPTETCTGAPVRGSLPRLTLIPGRTLAGQGVKW